MRRLLLAVLFLMLPAATLAPLSHADAAQTAAARGTYPTSYKCDKAKDVCFRIEKRLPTRYVTVFAGGVQNKTGNPINGNCTSKVSKTKSWTAGASVSGEIKAGIFAKVSATVSGSISRSMTSEYSVSADFKVPPHTTRACTYVFAVFRWKTSIFHRIEAYSETVTTSAPARLLWVIEDIR